MCDCHNKIKNLLAENVLKSIKNEVGFIDITSSQFDNEPLYFSGNDGSKSPIFIPFTVEYERKAKKSGNVRTYKSRVNYFPSFCPSCGEEYDKEAKK